MNQERTAIYKRFTILTLSVLFLLSSRLSARENVQIITQNPQQGSMIIGQYKGLGALFFDDRVLLRNRDGYFVFGVGRDAPETVYLTLISAAEVRDIPINIKQRAYKIEKVNGLAANKVNPRTDEEKARIKRESILIREARKHQSQLNHFLDNFIMPSKGRISGVYGSQRILNGEPKNPHFGLDIANKRGTPVLAPADGVVLLTHKDMFFSGGTIVLDHGFGITSSYIHLNSIDITEGEKVKQGQKIATIGSTGRSTGPHLDWRLNWFGQRLDPALLIKKAK
ncbi:MAG: M23 family metallopeptidase [Gammaproteobacteria bacterium]|nr:M23 family metallopeptidase [Gammaproteobacteria bacterium]